MADQITDADLREWERVCIAATAGPWSWDNRNWRREVDPFNRYVCGDIHESQDEDEDEPTLTATSVCVVMGNATSGDIQDRNAEFITTARTAMPRLIADRRELAAECERLRAMVEELEWHKRQEQETE